MQGFRDQQNVLFFLFKKKFYKINKAQKLKPSNIFGDLHRSF